MKQEINLGAGVSVDQVSTEVEKFWQQVMTDGSGARSAATAAGVPVDELSTVTASAIAVQRAREGVDPTLTGIVIGVATGAMGGVSANAIWALIDRVLIPYLKQKFGAGNTPDA